MMSSYLTHIHGSYSIEYGEYHHAYIGKYGKPHVDDAEHTKHKANALVAAGAVVVKDVAPNTVVGGVPAKFIKQVPQQ